MWVEVKISMQKIEGAKFNTINKNKRILITDLHEHIKF